jgi:hypothetical protein
MPREQGAALFDAFASEQTTAAEFEAGMGLRLCQIPATAELGGSESSKTWDMSPIHARLMTALAAVLPRALPNSAQSGI